METPQFQLETKTAEQVNNSIKAAFDSVNLINSIVSEPFETKKEKLIKPNIEHLSLMLSKDWFAAGLTTEQRLQIEACIVAGNNYQA
jgi:hypothetical protein